MDKRTLTALILSMIVLVGWQMLFLQPGTQQQQQPAATAPVARQMPEKPRAETVRAAEDKPETAMTPSDVARQQETLRIAGGEVVISNDSRMIENWSLADYKKPDLSGPVDLVSMTLQEGSLQLAFDAAELAYLANVRGDLKRDGRDLVWTYADENIRIERRITPTEGARYVDVVTRADFRKVQPKHAFLLVRARATGDSALDMDRKLVFWSDELGEIELAGTIETAYPKTPVSWVGTMDRYFTFAVIPRVEVLPRAVIQGLGTNAGRISMTFPVAGESVALPYRVYFGPKDLHMLGAVDPTLEETVSFGWLSFFANPLLQMMKWFYKFVQNYGVAIILLTLVVRLLTFPLTYKSMKNMRHMAKLQPKIKALQEKYKDDREALNREMMMMMRTQGYNPLAGCLPILVQLPVFFALYRVLYSAVELYQAPFMLWIQDLSEKDPYYITPVLLTGTMFLQQKITPMTVTDPVQQKVMQFMPVLFGVMMVNLPSGLTLYMLISTLAGIAQQFILNKKLDINVASQPAKPARAR